MALLRDYHAAIGEIIIKNPALQAVLMALELREAIGKLTDKWRRFGHDIGFGIQHRAWRRNAWHHWV